MELQACTWFLHGLSGNRVQVLMSPLPAFHPLSQLPSFFWSCFKLNSNPIRVVFLCGRLFLFLISVYVCVHVYSGDQTIVLDLLDKSWL